MWEYYQWIAIKVKLVVRVEIFDEEHGPVDRSIFTWQAIIQCTVYHTPLHMEYAAIVASPYEIIEKSKVFIGSAHAIVGDGGSSELVVWPENELAVSLVYEMVDSHEHGLVISVVYELVVSLVHEKNSSKELVLADTMTTYKFVACF